MAELADAPDLGSGVLRRAGSSPVIRTQEFSGNIKATLLQFHILLQNSGSFITNIESQPTSSRQTPPEPHSLVFYHAASGKTDFRD